MSDTNTDTIETSTKDNETSPLVRKALIVGQVFAIGAVIFSAWSSHTQSQAQIDKMAKIVAKYEVQLDKAIAEDKDIGKRYVKNLRDALKGLTPKEREILLSIYDSK
jgi:hypothetical protein